MSRTWLRGSTRPEWGHLRARPRPPSPPPPLPPPLQPPSSGLLLGPSYQGQTHGIVGVCGGALGYFARGRVWKGPSKRSQQHCDSASTTFLVLSCFCTSLLLLASSRSPSLYSLSCLPPSLQHSFHLRLAVLLVFILLSVLTHSLQAICELRVSLLAVGSPFPGMPLFTQWN